MKDGASWLESRARFRVLLITDRKLVAPRDVVEVCESALKGATQFPAGSVALQLREKDLDARDLCELANRLIPICRRYSVPILINGRIDVASAVGADGVQLPADSFSPAQARSLLGASRIIGVSTHSGAEIIRAHQQGASFALFGPIFPPNSKGLFGSLQGLNRLREVCRAAPIPVYAIGGINAERAREVISCASGVALIGAVIGASDPARAMRELLAATTPAVNEKDRAGGPPA
jgi:thiamine-phosphate pyrophosphorylase